MEQERKCESCKHVSGGRIVDGHVLTSQKCKRFKAGSHSLLTWTAVHKPNKCGFDRKAWEPKP